MNSLFCRYQKNNWPLKKKWLLYKTINTNLFIIYECNYYIFKIKTYLNACFTIINVFTYKILIKITRMKYIYQTIIY